METYSLALERAKEIGNKRAECEILSGLGNTCTMLGHFEMSIDLQQQVPTDDIEHVHVKCSAL